MRIKIKSQKYQRLDVNPNDYSSGFFSSDSDGHIPADVKIEDLVDTPKKQKDEKLNSGIQR